VRSAVTTTGFTLGDLDDYEPVSPDSQTVRRRWAEERNVLKDSASDWMPVVSAAFAEIRQKCGAADWDGERAKPITGRTVTLAEIVVQTLFAMLPKGTPAPDVLPEADGEICIDWSVDTDRIFSISVGEHGKANFAGQFGAGGGIHGWRPIETSNRSALEQSLRDVANYVEKVWTPAAGSSTG
jgi:hypothetical protein